LLTYLNALILSAFENRLRAGLV